MHDEHPTAATFDPGLGAWLVSRYDEVRAALRDPRLVAGGGADGAADESAHEAMRAATVRALDAARLAAWVPEFAAAAERLVAGLPRDEPVDLVAAYAAPWAVQVAAIVTGLAPEAAARIAPLAHAVFVASAESTDATVAPGATAATLDLARALQASARWPDVQTFVALSQTLPSVLAGAWRALLAQPDALRGAREALRTQPGLAPDLVEDLLRHAGPARAVFRRAATAMVIGDAAIAGGDRVILRLAAANHDPARFAAPERLDVARGSAGHLAFGAGRHRCPGSPVVRVALAVGTSVLLEAGDDIERLDGGTSGGGFAIRGAGTLPVRLSRPTVTAPAV